MELSSWIVQIQWLLTLAIPVACIAWTVTHEEVFREPREYCISQSKNGKTVLKRKFFYLFTCEYCFSHYVTIGILVMTGFRLLFTDWRGYVVSGFSIVWIANMYMAIFSLLRFGIKKEKMDINVKEEQIKSIALENEQDPKNIKSKERTVREMLKG
ncbi:MAG TPA: hypothetical protein VK489_14025 [Ferruginibacter sp.]|nr:hypothetical protein [Ferruginibacter sp.]